MVNESTILINNQEIGVVTLGLGVLSIVLIIILTLMYLKRRQEQREEPPKELPKLKQQKMGVSETVPTEGLPNQNIELQFDEQAKKEIDKINARLEIIESQVDKLKNDYLNLQEKKKKLQTYLGWEL